jgi:hypothetical protein
MSSFQQWICGGSRSGIATRVVAALSFMCALVTEAPATQADEPTSAEHRAERNTALDLFREGVDIVGAEAEARRSRRLRIRVQPRGAGADVRVRVDF